MSDLHHCVGPTSSAVDSVGRVDFGHSSLQAIRDENFENVSLDLISSQKIDLIVADYSFNSLESLVTTEKQSRVIRNCFEFHANDNQIKFVDCSFFSSMRMLTVVDLSNNCLVEFPPDLCNLAFLKILKLKNNLIETIPSNIKNLAPTLQILDLSVNLLTASIDVNVYKLTELQELNLKSNKIVHLPHEIRNLRSLTTLDISYNRITQIPLDLVYLTNLQRLFVSGNPLVSPPIYVCEFGLKHIMYYSASLLLKANSRGRSSLDNSHYDSYSEYSVDSNHLSLSTVSKRDSEQVSILRNSSFKRPLVPSDLQAPNTNSTINTKTKPPMNNSTYLDMKKQINANNSFNTSFNTSMNDSNTQPDTSLLSFPDMINDDDNLHPYARFGITGQSYRPPMQWFSKTDNTNNTNNITNNTDNTNIMTKNMTNYDILDRVNGHTQTTGSNPKTNFTDLVMLKLARRMSNSLHLDRSGAGATNQSASSEIDSNYALLMSKIEAKVQSLKNPSVRSSTAPSPQVTIKKPSEYPTFDDHIDRAVQLVNNQLRNCFINSTDEFVDRIKDGVILCQFVNSLYRNAIPVIKLPISNTQPLCPIKAKSNLKSFVDSLVGIGIDYRYYGGLDDILNLSNIRAICEILIQLVDIKRRSKVLNTP